MVYYFRSYHTARYLAFQMTRRITRQEKWEALVANDESNPKETGVSSWKTIQEITDVGLFGEKMETKDTVNSLG